MVYEILTWMIIRLAEFREWLYKNSFVLRKDRDEACRLDGAQDHLKGYGFLLICCDCNLAHRIYNWKGTRDLHCIPLRPREYKYLMR